MTRIIPKAFCLGLVMLLAMAASAMAGTSHKLMVEGIEAYHAGDYDLAISRFSAIAHGGVANPKLFYNLGNAYYKNNDLGKAILWYERAAAMGANDPELKFNLAYARSRIKDEDETAANRLFHILFFWYFALSPKTVWLAAITVNAVFWLILAVNAVLKRRTSRLFCWIAGTCVLILTVTGFYRFYEEKFVRQAIITGIEAPVRSGWTTDATKLFVLHAGTKVRVEKEQNGYFRISFGKDKIGWLKKQDAEII